MVKTKRSDYISMKMFKQAKFICLYTECGKSFPLKNSNYNKNFKCPYQSILFPTLFLIFNNVKTLIIYSITCTFYFMYCAICKSLYNVSVPLIIAMLLKFTVKFFWFLNIITTFRHLITPIKCLYYN